jgi:hypothetical protein
MFRKITLVAVPAVAVAVMLFANADSQAFAKGGGGGSRGGRQMTRNDRGHRGFRFDRRYNRYYGWGYAGYSCVEYPTCACTVDVQPEVPVVEAPVVEAPVCPTCQPVCSSFDGSGYFGYRHFRHDFRSRGRSDRQVRSGGHGRR